MSQENNELRQQLADVSHERDLLRALLKRVIDSSVLAFEKDAPEDIEELEADICAALKPWPFAECDACNTGAPVEFWNKRAHPADQQGEPYPDGIADQLERTDWTPQDALQWYADGKHFDVVHGRTRIIDTGHVASNALKHASLSYLEMKGDAELIELRAQVADQQGDPVVFVDALELRNLKVSGFDSFSALLHREQASILCPQRVPLYRHAQPATAKVDERKSFDDWTISQGRVLGYTGWSRDFAIWQARAKLNGGQS